MQAMDVNRYNYECVSLRRKEKTLLAFVLSLVGLEPRKKIERMRDRVCWSAQALEMCRCGRSIVHTHPSAKRLCDYVSRISSWLQDDQVFQLLSSLHHKCQIFSRLGSLTVRPEWSDGSDLKREPCCCCCCDVCCCCCESVKLGSAEGSAAAILCVNFCILEYVQPCSSSGYRFACICPFAPCCDGGCDHWNLIYPKLSFFLRSIQ